MKISSPTQPDFTPVSVTLTFETQDELDALAALLNYTPVTAALSEAANSAEMSVVLREGLKSFGASTQRKFQKIQALIEERV